jgi:hypothetical protein
VPNKKYKWKAGRVVGVKSGSTVSYSTIEAYHLIPVDEDMEEVCKDVLLPYKEADDELRDLTNG